MFDLLPFERRRNDMMNFFGDWGKDFFGEMGDQISAFRTDIMDKGDHYLLEAELPGFDKKDIDIDINGDTLTISAKHEANTEDKKDNYIRRERSYGSFVRSFDVSTIDAANIKACLLYTSEIPDYAVNLFLTQEGYFKKITPLSLRMGGEQKLKEGDAISTSVESTNTAELLFFTDRQQVYKTRACEFDDQKASVLGEYIPARLGMDEGESVAAMIVTTDYSGYLVFVFQNGKAAKVPLSAYETKTRRKKLTTAYSDKSPLVAVFYVKADCELLLKASSQRMLLVNTALIPVKTTKSTQGVQVMTCLLYTSFLTSSNIKEVFWCIRPLMTGCAYSGQM